MKSSQGGKPGSAGPSTASGPRHRSPKSRCSSNASSPSPYTPTAKRWQKNDASTNSVDTARRSATARSRSATQLVSAHSASPIPNK